MASALRTRVEQDMTQHALGHILGKLKGRLGRRTTFLIVEGSDDLAFYLRFFDTKVVSAYYSTKTKEDGTVVEGGCPELQNIVEKVLGVGRGRTDKVIGIMDTDYRKYEKKYVYPQNVFHTDCRDMEMTVLNAPSVRQALSSWINGFENLWNQLMPALRYAGTLRILNDIFRLGCSFKKKCKIDQVFDNISHQITPDWKHKYLKAFITGCLEDKKHTKLQILRNRLVLCWIRLCNMSNRYSQENFFDVSQGHDTLHLLSLSLVRTDLYSEDAIWEKCFDAYTPADFAITRLYASINAWQVGMGLSIFSAQIP